MEMMDILQIGARLIQGNSDEATTNLDIGAIAAALQNVVGSEGGLDLGSLIASFSQGGFADVVSSWIGRGENAPISREAVAGVLGSEKIAAFASQLGVSEESAKQALSDALPGMIDQVTDKESSLAEDLLSNIGGLGGMLGKFGF